ncbi:ribonuclease M5 [Brevibacillus dissolubilis]|uniref:ribonuclease M5 n=1 Tax=Brevibacillus dissolubilis TaxID=1844116 RepID=UPI001116890F|nr:ribonuclease M5 [Brevibacillus dissolubilis]
MKIKEVIVVEGRDDTAAIKRAVNADTIETGGSAINDEVIRRIRHAQEKRGVIVFTDPDFQGERIRKIISREVPGCKHAFITREESIKKGDLGVENADPDVIIRALSSVRTEVAETTGEITLDDLIAAGMVAGSDAADRRKRLGELLGIGYANAKQMQKRLNMFQISLAEFEQAVATLNEGRENA